MDGLVLSLAYMGSAGGAHDAEKEPIHHCLDERGTDRASGEVASIYVAVSRRDPSQDRAHGRAGIGQRRHRRAPRYGAPDREQVAPALLCPATARPRRAAAWRAPSPLFPPASWSRSRRWRVSCQRGAACRWPAGRSASCAARCSTRDWSPRLAARPCGAGSAKMRCAPGAIAAWDVHRAKLFGRCEPTTGIAPFERLVAHVMRHQPYRSARRVFWIVDNGTSHRGQRAAQRLQAKWPNIVLVHTPVHASWLNQIEVYFSVVQGKLLTPNDFPSLATPEDRLLAFQQRYQQSAKPFQWTFTRRDLHTLLRKLDPSIPRRAT